MMSEIKNIHQRLLEVMKEVTYIQKEDKQVNNQYRFVSHDAVTAKVRPVFIEKGILVIPTVKEFTQDGNRICVTMSIDFINVDNINDKITVEYIGHGIDTQDKGPGKAISYAVKYAYLKVLGLETGDDPERGNDDHLPENKVITPKVNVPKLLSDKIAQELLNTIEKATSANDLKEKYDKAKLYATQKNDKVFFALIKEATARIKIKLEGEPNEPFSK